MGIDISKMVEKPYWVSSNQIVLVLQARDSRLEYYHVNINSALVVNRFYFDGYSVINSFNSFLILNKQNNNECSVYLLNLNNNNLSLISSHKKFEIDNSLVINSQKSFVYSIRSLNNGLITVCIFDIQTNLLENEIEIPDYLNIRLKDICTDHQIILFEYDNLDSKDLLIFDYVLKEFETIHSPKYELSGSFLIFNCKQVFCVGKFESATFQITYNLKQEKFKTLSQDIGVYTHHIRYNQNTILFMKTKATTPPVLFKVNLLTNTFIQVLNSLKHEPTYQFVDLKFLKYLSSGEILIPGILYMPKTKNANSYPAIIYVHGGPADENLQSFNLYSQILVSLGFVVFLPNYRGSSGYGENFEESNKLDWGGEDYNDLLFARKYLIENYNVDPERIGLLGLSYGAYLTLTCLVRSIDLHFTAGCVWGGFYHLTQLYENSSESVKYFLEYYMGSKKDYETFWEERSPLNYLENLSSALLIIHGKRDELCPISGARTLFEKLKSIKKQSKTDLIYIEYDDEHIIWRNVQLRKKITLQIMQFFVEKLNR